MKRLDVGAFDLNEKIFRDFVKWDCTDGKKIQKHWDEASGIDDFFYKVTHDDSLRDSDDLEGRSVWAKLSKYSSGHKQRILDAFRAVETIRLATESDAGGVKIKFQGGGWLNISNGEGDGLTTVVVVEARLPELARLMLDFQAMIHGPAGICDYDCGNDVVFELDNARYLVYSGGGVVVFEKLGAKNE